MSVFWVVVCSSFELFILTYIFACMSAMSILYLFHAYCMLYALLPCFVLICLFIFNISLK